MISPRFAVDRRTCPTILVVALPQLAFLRALLVRTCSFGIGTHGPLCYLTLSSATIARSVLSVVVLSVAVGVLLDRFVLRRLPRRIRSTCPAWLTSPSTPTLTVVGVLLAGFGLLVALDPRLSFWWAVDDPSVSRAVTWVAAWGLYVPSAGVAFGGNYFAAVLRGMVGVTALPVRLLVFAGTIVSSLLQVVWWYAIAAGLVGGYRRVRVAVTSNEPSA